MSVIGLSDQNRIKTEFCFDVPGAVRQRFAFRGKFRIVPAGGKTELAVSCWFSAIASAEKTQS